MKFVTLCEPPLPSRIRRFWILHFATLDIQKAPLTRGISRAGHSRGRAKDPKMEDPTNQDSNHHISTFTHNNILVLQFDKVHRLAGYTSHHHVKSRLCIRSFGRFARKYRESGGSLGSESRHHAWVGSCHHDGFLHQVGSPCPSIGSGRYVLGKKSCMSLSVLYVFDHFC